MRSNLSITLFRRVFSRPAIINNAMNKTTVRTYRLRPVIQETPEELTEKLLNIGVRLPIPTAPLYFTPQKINYIVREMKTKENLQEVQKTLLLCDAKRVYPSTVALGRFFKQCIVLETPEIALEFLRNAKHMKHYIKNLNLIRVLTYYAEANEHEIVSEIYEIALKHEIEPTTKFYNFKVGYALKQEKLNEAIAIAKEAANLYLINSNTILLLMPHLEEQEQKIALAKYLIDKGEVYVNERLKNILG